MDQEDQPVEKSYICESCGRIFTRVSHGKRHMLTVHYFKCDDCNAIINDEEIIRCEYEGCGKTFNDWMAYCVHEKVHVFRCPNKNCPIAFKSQEEVDAHVKLVANHNDDPSLGKNAKDARSAGNPKLVERKVDGIVDVLGEEIAPALERLELHVIESGQVVMVDESGPSCSANVSKGQAKAKTGVVCTHSICRENPAARCPEMHPTPFNQFAKGDAISKFPPPVPKKKH